MRTPTAKDLIRHIRYDSEHGTFWRWSDGSSAICKAGNGYVGITFKGFYILAHRAAWLMTYGSLDGNIDHIDGNPANNWIGNLRLATQQENCRNRRPKRTSKSGIKGVSYNATRGKWEAYICVDGKQKNLGRYRHAHEASDAYKRAAKEFFGEFART